MKHKQILVVDDEAPMRRILEIILQGMGHTVRVAADGQEAFELLQASPADLVITDLRMPRMDGLTLLQQMREEGMDAPVILITAYGSVETAVEAMKYGASDFIIRPFENQVVEVAVQRALAASRMRSENVYLRQQLESDWHEFVGQSEPMQRVYHAIERVAPTQATVLIIGETGTGKELAARALHKASGRSGLFVPINCAAIPTEMLESELFGYVRGAFTGASKDHPGRFEVADGGTVFLDEITEMPIELQTKLLRVLQEGCVERLGSNRSVPLDFRLVAATNRDPLDAVESGRLREDLYYRLNVFSLELPPLRERDGDIALLSRYFLETKARSLGRSIPHLPGEAMRQLQAYAWPGNVRELENVIERALILADEKIKLSDLPGSDRAIAKEATALSTPTASSIEVGPLQIRLDAMEGEMIRAALEESGNNKAKAARLLEISERSLWYKLKKHGIS